jgi:GT2 family glycosyltransferase
MIARFVVVNYNGGDLVVNCIDSILAQQFHGTIDVVVVDNASADGSVAMVAERFGDSVRVIVNDTNRGFVAANQAMTRVDGLADPDMVALVNPDATIEPDWLTRLSDALATDPAIGAASPCMLFAHQFVDLVVTSPSESGGSDPRDLAVQLLDVRTTTTSLLGRAHAAHGVHDVEQGPTGGFRWLAGTATLGIPVDRTNPATTVELTLAAPTTKQVTISCVADPSGDVPTGRPGAATVTVGPRPTTHVIALAGPAHDLVANAGSLVFDDGTGADRGHFAPLAPPLDQPCDLFAWCGGGVLLRSAYLRDVGLFEPGLFLYYEDTDLSWRGRSMGWRHVYVPAARMHHVQGASGGSLSDMFVVSTTRNRLLMVVRNGSPAVVRRAAADVATSLWASLRHEVVTPVMHLRRPRLRMLGLRCRALASVMVDAPAAMASRRRLKRKARVAADVVEAGLVVRHQVRDEPQAGR